MRSLQVVVTLALTAACSRSSAPTERAPAAPSSTAAATVAAPSASVATPAEFERLCIGCHSETYLAAQPPLKRASWEKIMKKHVEGYGAAWTPAEGTRMIDYAVAHNPPK